MINVLFAASDANWTTYQGSLMKSFDVLGLEVNLQREMDAKLVDYIVYAPSSELQDFTPFTNCKAVLSLWAGVEKIVGNETLTQTLCRMVDPGLTQGMVEWVTGHTLRYHLNIDANLQAQNGDWVPVVPPLASERKVAVLGLGELGQTCAKTLSALGFNVVGWSRRPKEIDRIPCYSGNDGLVQAISQSEIIVLLLPNTPETENTLNASTINMLPRGARIINPGRGTLIDDDALLDALNSGQIGHATLDVFRVEPLPADHPYWAHPNVTVTPHIAAETRASTASQVIAENIRRGEVGEPLLYQVDRETGY